MATAAFRDVLCSRSPTLFLFFPFLFLKVFRQFLPSFPRHVVNDPCRCLLNVTLCSSLPSFLVETLMLSHFPCIVLKNRGHSLSIQYSNRTKFNLTLSVSSFKGVTCGSTVAASVLADIGQQVHRRGPSIAWQPTVS